MEGKGRAICVHSGEQEPKLTNDEAKQHNQLMSKLKQTIWNMPVRYAGGGEDFSILQYDKAEKAVVMGADMWRELSLTGSWIQDATVLRWAELTSRLSKGALKPSTVIDCLLSYIESEREVAEARNVYQGWGTSTAYGRISSSCKGSMWITSYPLPCGRTTTSGTYCP